MEPQDSRTGWLERRIMQAGWMTNLDMLWNVEQ
jgi:hypothetical protein